MLNYASESLLKDRSNERVDSTPRAVPSTSKSRLICFVLHEELGPRWYFIFSQLKSRCDNLREDILHGLKAHARHVEKAQPNPDSELSLCFTGSLMSHKKRSVSYLLSRKEHEDATEMATFFFLEHKYRPKRSMKGRRISVERRTLQVEVLLWLEGWDIQATIILWV